MLLPGRPTVLSTGSVSQCVKRSNADVPRGRAKEIYVLHLREQRGVRQATGQVLAVLLAMGLKDVDKPA